MNHWCERSTQNMKNIINCSCAWYSDISTITHLAKYRLIIVIEKIPKNIEIYFLFNIAHPYFHESGVHSLQLHITHGLHLPSCTALTHSQSTITPITQLSPFNSSTLIVSPHLHLIHTHTYKQLTSLHSPQSLVLPRLTFWAFPLFSDSLCLPGLPIYSDRCCLPLLTLPACWYLSVCCLPRPLHCPCCWFCPSLHYSCYCLWPLPVWPLVWKKSTWLHKKINKKKKSLFSKSSSSLSLLPFASLYLLNNAWDLVLLPLPLYVASSRLIAWCTPQL